MADLVRVSPHDSFENLFFFLQLHIRNGGLSNLAMLTTSSEVSYGLIKALGKQVNTVNLLDTVHV